MLDLSKKRVTYTEMELTRLEVFGKAWKAAMMGNKVCLVSPMVVDWKQVLGSYYDSMIKYVNDGLIYLRVLNDETGEDTLIASDLDNVVLEIAEAL